MIEKFGDGGFVVTGDSIRAVGLMTLIRALEFEVKTGMKMSHGSLLKTAELNWGVKSRRKEKAIVELKKIFNETFGQHYDVD